MHKVYVTYTCFPGQRETFLGKIKEEKIDTAIRAEDGCRQYEYYLSDSNPDVILLLEEWDSKEHQAVHYTQPHMHKLAELKKEYVQEVFISQFKLIE